MNNLRELRLEKGYTQFELAIKLGVTPVTIRFWEHGVGKPTPKNMKKLLQVFPEFSEEVEE